MVLRQGPPPPPDPPDKPTPQRDPDTICGVSRDLIERFLILIRDNYKKADKATFFLEQRTGAINVPGITNVRDVLSHLVTLLSPDTPPDKLEEQLGNAEEHLRRSIIEPYEISLNELTVKFEEVYQNYKKYVLPNMEKHIGLRSAPNAVSVEAILTEIRRLTSKGRASKGENLWNPEWENGVANFISAYNRLFDLKTELETYYFKYEQTERDAAQAQELIELRSQVKELSGQITAESGHATRLQIGGIGINLFGIIIGVVGIFLAALFFLFPGFAETIKAYFK